MTAKCTFLIQVEECYSQKYALLSFSTCAMFYCFLSQTPIFTVCAFFYIVKAFDLPEVYITDLNRKMKFESILLKLVY
jgi:hypothetical protein